MKLNQTLMAVIFAAGALALAGNADASIVYDVNEVVTGIQGVGGIVGTITTDGTLGGIDTNNITAWNLIVTGGSETPLHLVSGSSGVFTSGTALTATPNNISFDFSATGYLLFQTSFESASQYCSFGANGQAVVEQGLSAVPTSGDTLLINEPVSGTQIIGSVAATTAVPEPTTVLAGVLMLVPFGTGLLRKMRKIAGSLKS